MSRGLGDVYKRQPLYDFTPFGSREYPNHPDLFEQLAGQGRYRDSQKQKRFDVTGIRIPKKIKLHKHHIKYGLRDIL